MTYADLGFLNAVQSIKPPDYLGMAARSFALSQELPWSARETRKRQLEDTQLAMQQAKFQADMARQAREMQIQEMLLPYKLQQAQRLATGSPATGGYNYNLGDGMPTEGDYYDELVTGFGVVEEPLPTEPVMAPPEMEIPVLTSSPD